MTADQFTISENLIQLSVVFKLMAPNIILCVVAKHAWTRASNTTLMGLAMILLLFVRKMRNAWETIVEDPSAMLMPNAHMIGSNVLATNAEIHANTGAAIAVNMASAVMSSHLENVKWMLIVETHHGHASHLNVKTSVSISPAHLIIRVKKDNAIQINENDHFIPLKRFYFYLDFKLLNKNRFEKKYQIKSYFIAADLIAIFLSYILNRSP